MTPGQPYGWKETEAVCQKLLKAGWITAFCFHEGAVRYGIKWTPEGLRRAKLLNQTAGELGLSPQEFCELLRIFRLTAPNK
jgi:hypothetical protein